ncbi:MAG: class I SAM-dependent methyltransferase [Desulfobulbaceae bacterium]|nr:class I SAM-dependent methyltransferase [Desulfobulbaceae bacterium]
MKNRKTIEHPILAIAVEYKGSEHKHQALLLAENLNLPLVGEDEQYDLILRCTDKELELYRPGDRLLTGSVRAEFVQGPSGYRRNRGGTEILVRAIGHKRNSRTKVLDATGGLGRDAFIMASHGCQVRIMEKNPVVAALLADGLRRASSHPETREISRRISLITGNSRDLLMTENMEDEFDVIYIDPMFPQRSKSARVKKELQILQQLVGPDADIDKLFAAALQKAGKRVVVKRPKGAPSLQGPNPSCTLGGRTIRFDVYLIRS